MRFTVDSNYLISLLQSWHAHHPVTLADLERRLSAGDQFQLIAHTLLEAYSVLTRLPEPFRKPPALVFELLERNFRQFPLLSQPVDIWMLLQFASENAAGGGKIYDWAIAKAAEAGGMDYLVTWNAKHFASYQFGRLRVLQPAS